MTSYKIHIIFLVLILIQQTAFSKSIDDTSSSIDSSEEDMRNAATPTQKLFIYTFEHFVPLGQYFNKNAVNISRYILKDESLLANNKNDVMDLKKNLTQFVEKYDIAKGHIYTQDILDIYSNITHYYELPEEKVTPEITLILDILNKYNCKDVVEQFVKEFTAFRLNFVKLFEENKADLEKPLLEWYKNYNTLRNFGEKFDAFSEFLKLA